MLLGFRKNVKDAELSMTHLFTWNQTQSLALLCEKKMRYKDSLCLFTQNGHLGGDFDFSIYLSVCLLKQSFWNVLKKIDCFEQVNAVNDVNCLVSK